MYTKGDLVAITDALGNVTKRFLDAAGRLVSLTNPLGYTSTLVYYLLGLAD